MMHYKKILGAVLFVAVTASGLFAATAKIQVPKVIDCLSECGFTLTSFKSNVQSVLESIPDTVSPTNVPLTTEDSTRALGIIWNIKKDTFGYKICMDYEDNVTKRNVLKILASVYDPLGVASPTLIEAKKIFQEACKLHLQWDGVLPASLQKSWKKWIENINCLTDFEVPRCMKRQEFHSRAELHTYADGSERAYGCVSYLKLFYEDGSVSTSLVASKSRLTPLNNSTLKTIPRIELSAAKLAVELSCKLVSELDIEVKCYFGRTVQSF